MTFADVLTRTTFTNYSAANEAIVTAAFGAVYGTATGASMIDNFLANAANSITFTYSPNGASALTNTGNVTFDPAFSNNFIYINRQGVAVQEVAAGTVAHELVHALTGRLDKWKTQADYSGDTVTFANVIFTELGIDEQLSYPASSISGTLELGRDYAKGASIDRAFSNGNNWASADSANDLLIGNSSANIFNGGDGEDILVGNDGDDTLIGGGGIDTAVYDGNQLDYDIRQNADSSWTVRHARGAQDEGEDTLIDIEKIRFDDGDTFDLKKGALTFQTDFSLVIDTTGSMGSSINQVKVQATELINAAFKEGNQDARIGVVGFKDTTIGEPTTIIQSFTDQDDFADRKTAAVDAINAIGVSGGGDLPETSFDGLLKALDGSMGDWRTGASIKRIALFTDASAKDVSLMATVNALAANIGATITSSSTSTGASGSLTEFTYEIPTDEIGEVAVSRFEEVDDVEVPIPTPTPDTTVTTVQVFTIFTGGEGIDTSAHESIAESTGGGYFTTDTEDLVDILFEIIELPGNSIPTVDDPVELDDIDEDDGATVFTEADFLAGATDADEDDILRVENISVTAGTIVLQEGDYLYTPDPDFTGEVTFTYDITDGEATISQSATLNIVSSNEAPVLDNELADQTSEEDTAVSFTIPDDAFSDPDGDELTYTAGLSTPIILLSDAAASDDAIGSPLPEWLSFDADTLTFSGTPPTDFNGSLDVAVTATDPDGLSESDTFTLEITSVNDAPIVANELEDQTSEEDTAINFTIPEDAFSDVDNFNLTLSAQESVDGGSPLPEWLSFDADSRTFSGTPPQDFVGLLELIVTASDGELTVSDTFFLEITPVNDAPVLDNPIADQAFEEDTAVSFTIPSDTFSDPEDDDLTYTASLSVPIIALSDAGVSAAAASDGPALPDWLSFDPDTLTFSGTPPANYHGTVDVTVTASDGELSESDTFTLEITPVNDGPVAVDDDGIEAEAGTALTIAAADLLANDSDVDGDDLSIVTVVSTSGNADVSLDGDGNVVYTASGDFDGDDSFTYTVSDGNGGSATATVSVSVEGDDTTDPYEGWVVGTTGRDYLYGNFFSSNLIYGDDGNDRIYGGFRSDQLDGGEGNDRIYGRWGDDIINGDGGNDRIYGGSGNDTLNGGEGNDRISGGWGNDTISGGEGNDQLWGGWGQDNFVFNTGDGNDTVRDFSTGFSWWWFRVAGDTITLDVDGIENFDDVLEAASQNGRHTTFDFGDDDSLTLRNTRLSSLDQDDFTIL